MSAVSHLLFPHCISFLSLFSDVSWALLCDFLLLVFHFLSEQLRPVSGHLGIPSSVLMGNSHQGAHQIGAEVHLGQVSSGEQWGTVLHAGVRLQGALVRNEAGEQTEASAYTAVRDRPGTLDSVFVQ